MSIDVVTLALAKAYADELVANGSDPEKIEQIIRDKINEVLGSIGGGADWAVNDETAAGYIKNRTHYEGTPIHVPELDSQGKEVYWSGPQEGDFGIPMAELDGEQVYCYKVSNVIITTDQMKNIGLTDIFVNVGGAITQANELYEKVEIEEVEGIPVILLNAVFGENYCPILVSVSQNFELQGIAIESGVYFSATKFQGIDFFMSKIKTTNIKQLDLKYIPEIAFSTVELTKSGSISTLIITDRYGKEQRTYIQDGPMGRTPERGKDYWTNEDIAVIKGYVENAIIGGSW